MLWDCSDECIDNEMGGMCFAICFQTQTGHVDGVEATNMMLECTTACSMTDSTCIIDCLFPKVGFHLIYSNGTNMAGKNRNTIQI